MTVVLHRLQGTSWIQRLFLLILGANFVLVLLGLLVVPSSLGDALSTVFSAPDGLRAWVGAVGIQVVLTLLALVGPLSFDKYPRTIGISLAFGALFAAAYLGFLARDFAGMQFGIDDGPVTIYALFIGVALLAGAAASVRTQRLRDGIVAAVWALLIGTAIWSMGLLLMDYALWGSPHWYQFWLQDGAVSDFHQSGGTDLAVFLLQDVQGALFFHQVLSAVIGVTGGLVGSALTLGPAALWRLLRRPTLPRA